VTQNKYKVCRPNSWIAWRFGSFVVEWRKSLCEWC